MHRCNTSPRGEVDAKETEGFIIVEHMEVVQAKCQRFTENWYGEFRNRKQD